MSGPNAFTADIHAGNHKRFGGPVSVSLNKRCTMVLDVLDAAVDRAIALKCSSFTVLGDLARRHNSSRSFKSSSSARRPHQ